MIYFKLFLAFFYIGLFTIGGGYAMIPLVKEVVVQNNNWITVDQFQTMIGLSECTPGPIALNMATFVGATQGNIAGGPFGGFLGGLLATLGVVLPSFIIICIIAALLTKVAQNIYVKSTLKGAAFVAMGLIASIALIMFGQTISNFNFSNFHFDIQGIKVLGISAFIYALIWILRKKKPGALTTIGISALVGLLVNLLWK